jgi:iron complex outermembrane recepter protein
MKKIFQTIFLMLFVVVCANAQDRMVSGMVSEGGAGLPGVSVRIKGTNTGTQTDDSGKFSVKAPAKATTLVISYLGYNTIEAAIPSSNVVNVSMEANASELGEVVISTGSRASQRTITSTPLPIDVLGAKDIMATGQTTFDRALQYRVPSFNSVQTPVNDATSLLDPYEIRNMGPSRTLILINGKRKNSSALCYIQTSPGRGESGADISAIPTDAIQRVEILRDGASAQYGSDAVAGVMNIILKDRSQFGSVTLNTGMTHKGDGQQLGFSFNNGTTFKETGFVNYTVSLSRQALSNRPGDVDPVGEFNDFLYTNPASLGNYLDSDGKLAGQSLAGLSDAEKNTLFEAYKATPEYTTAFNGINQGNTDGLKQTTDFVAKYPDAGNINGDPAKAAARFLVNFGVPVGDNTEFYGNAAYIYKKVNSFANYRTPYWRGPANNPYAIIAANEGRPYEGYVPGFEGDLVDYNGTVGFRKINNGWKSDVSFTTGYNKQLYTVTNSRNRGLGLNTPLTFKPGGYSFKHNVGNIDISKSLLDNLNFNVGTEFRQENYAIITTGDTASYVKNGADSFPGTTPDNAKENTRFNIGAYAGLSYDITDAFLIDGTFRAERYSDFGNTSVFKISSRYLLNDEKVTIRGSFSTGFRAPSLHQIYLQIAQASFVPGQGIQTKGIFNNNSTQAALLGVGKLTPEKSTNISFGVGLTPTRNMSFTFDYYNIAVDDRIILGSEVAESDATTELGKLLKENGIVAASFWTNAIDTRTSGLDFVASYRNVKAGAGKLAFNLAGNYTIQNGLKGAKSTSEYEKGNISIPNGTVNNPASIARAGKSVFDITQEALLFTSRPKYKAIFGVDFNIKKISINLNNTLFGPTAFRNAGLNENLKVVFAPKVVTDLGFSWEFAKNTTFSFTVQNLLNVVPEWSYKALNAAGEAVKADQDKLKGITNAITFNGRYSGVTYDGSHFSQLGTTLAASVNVRF